MKVKILLVPLFLVSSITIFIWLLYPTFSEFREKKNDLLEAQNQVADIETKLEKTSILKKELSNNSLNQEMIYSFLPEAQNEEEVIDILNNIAASEGVSISSISIDKPKALIEPTRVSTEDSGANSLSASGFSVGSENAEANTFVPSANVRNFIASMRVSGSYERIRNVIGKLNKTKRFNRIRVLSINKNNNQDNDANVLSLDLEINFNYLEKVKTVNSLNNQIFTSGKFNLASVIESLEQYRTGYISNLNSGNSGKSNPFLP